MYSSPQIQSYIDNFMALENFAETILGIIVNADTKIAELKTLIANQALGKKDAAEVGGVCVECFRSWQDVRPQRALT